MKIVNIVKIENESEYGYSIEMLYNFFRIGLFICSEPKTITFLFGLWKINFIFEAIKG